MFPAYVLTGTGTHLEIFEALRLLQGRAVDVSPPEYTSSLPYGLYRFRATLTPLNAGGEAALKAVDEHGAPLRGSLLKQFTTAVHHPLVRPSAV